MRMRPTFLLNQDNQLISAIAHKSHLSVGMCLMLTREYDTGYGLIPAGTKGWIEVVHPEEGCVQVRWEGAEPALYAWGNVLILVPFSTDDLTDALVVYDHKADLTGPTDPPQSKGRFASKRAKFAMRVAACFLIVFVWGLLLEPAVLACEGSVVDVLTYLEGFVGW